MIIIVKYIKTRTLTGSPVDVRVHRRFYIIEACYNLICSFKQSNAIAVRIAEIHFLPPYSIVAGGWQSNPLALSVS